MPKRTDIKKIMIIGSGPIVIGQAAEFDYAGTQACLALKEEGYEVVLVNSNPATIMTDTSIADKVYMEPLTLEYVADFIPTSPANPLIVAPITNEIAEDTWKKAPNIIDTITMNIMSTFHSSKRNVFAPLLIMAEISTISAVPSGINLILT